MKIDKKKITFLLFLLFMAAFFYVIEKAGRKEDEIEKLKVELAHAQIYQPLQYTVIHDTVPVASAPVSTVSKSSYKQSLADRDELKELKIKAGQIKSQETEVTAIHDTVRLIRNPIMDSFSYKDRWATFYLSLKDSTLDYTVRDSLKTYVVRQYKHHFLFWHWGTKGYDVKILNYNPHARIKYDSYIMID